LALAAWFHQVPQGFRMNVLPLAKLFTGGHHEIIRAIQYTRFEDGSVST